MTQEGLEKILSDYVSIMDSFKSINVVSPVSDGATQAYYDNYDNSINTNDHQEENPTEGLTAIPKRSSSVSAATQPSLITETSTISSSSSTTTTTTTEQKMDVKKENKRKSFRLSQQRRISWTSDTGLTSFAASQYLAGELMSLFDMEFKVEISVDPYAGTAPQLPELSYFKEKQNRNNNRSSVDSFMCLIPAFESFQIDNYDGHSYVSKANKRISTLSNGVNNKRLSSSLSPTRSSSLKYKNKHSPSSTNKSIHENINDSYAKLNNGNSNTSSISPLYDSQKLSSSSSSSTIDLQVHKTLTKKKSIRKLVSLFGKKKLNANDSIPNESATLKSASSSNLTSSVELISSSASYSSSETNLNKPNLHVDTQFNNNNNNNSYGAVSYNQRPTNPTSLSDNTLYTNKNSPSTPETQFSSSSPSSNITLEEKKRRRRSNSVPDISTNKYHHLQQQKHSILEQPINNQTTTPTTTTYQKDIPSSSSSSSNITLIPTSSTSTATTTSPIESNDHYLTHSKSVYEFSTVPPRRKQSLSRSPNNLGNQPSSNNQHLYYQQHQQHDSRLYHSTHDLSKLYTNDTGGIGNVLNDSKDSILSPNDNKKSSLMSRMTSFARRKKPTVKQSVQV